MLIARSNAISVNSDSHQVRSLVYLLQFWGVTVKRNADSVWRQGRQVQVTIGHQGLFYGEGIDFDHHVAYHTPCISLR